MDVMCVVPIHGRDYSEPVADPNWISYLRRTQQFNAQDEIIMFTLRR
jgi:hypothetical protein